MFLGNKLSLTGLFLLVASSEGVVRRLQTTSTTTAAYTTGKSGKGGKGKRGNSEVRTEQGDELKVCIGKCAKNC